MARKITTEIFIEDAKKIHGDKYLYHKVIYKNNRTKIDIYCKECGTLFSQRPDNHIYRKHGCPACAKKSMADKQRMGLDEFIKKAKEVHGDKYDYGSVVYETNRKHVKIFCKGCLEFFMQRPYSHLRGWGHQKCCSDCFSPTNYGKAHSKSKIYILNLFNGDEDFYKIGITSKSINERFKDLSDYSCKVLFEKEFSGYDARKIEINLHKLHKKYKYTPNIKFFGSTECFSRIDLPLIKQTINKFEVGK